jgi:hypothetical protein
VPDDWNPFDSDDTRVHYDLAAWTFEQQADLASDLADAEIPHAWDGSELLIPEEFEAATDAIIELIEERLGINDAPTSSAIQAIPLPDGTDSVEYDLGDWPDADRTALSESLVAGEIPFRWDASRLMVGVDDEPAVDELLDSIERGEIVAEQLDDAAAVNDHDALSVLTTMFLSSDRLARSPSNLDALEALLRAKDDADPSHPPFGIEKVVWERACSLTGEICDLMAGDEVDPVAAQDAADELSTLLRPYV